MVRSSLNLRTNVAIATLSPYVEGAYRCIRRGTVNRVVGMKLEEPASAPSAYNSIYAGADPFDVAILRFLDSAGTTEEVTAQLQVVSVGKA